MVTRLALVLLATALAGCDSLPDQSAIEGDLYDQLAGRRAFAAFAEALADAGEAGLVRAGDVTVLAPTDIAFAYVGEDIAGLLFAGDDPALPRRILRTHVVAGRLGPDDFVDGDTLRTVDGLPLPVRRIGPVVRVGGATLDVSEPIEGDGGGVAYPLADVLLSALTVRERLGLSPSLSRFDAALSRTGVLDGVVGDVTVLAPLDGSVASLGALGDRLFFLEDNRDILDRVASFHIVPGVPPLADGASLTTADGDALEVRVEGGVTTVGGRRVLREEPTADGRLVVLGGLVLEPLTIAERLRIQPEAATYWRQLEVLAPVLWARAQDPDARLTFFVPTATAYDARGADLNNELVKPANAALNLRLLTIHAVEGAWPADELVSGARLPSIEGAPLVVDRRDGDLVTVDGLEIVDVGGRSVNGHVYLVDAFFTPDVDGFDASILRGFTAHANAVRRAGLEAQFRAGVTTFVAPNGYYDQPGVRDDPRAFLLRNTAEALVPRLGDLTLQMLDGSTRRIEYDPAICDLAPPRDPCSPFYFADERAQVYQGNASPDGTSLLHIRRWPPAPYVF